MVRFKNRHLLVEFLDPAHLSAFPTVPPSLQPPALDEDGNDDNGDDGGDGEDELAQIPDLPFMLPLDVAAKPLLGDGGASEVFKSVRSCVQAVFGDEGWGRVASSFKVIYHSSLTTLTILRIARPHYRVIWAALTLCTNINGVPVLPRVIAVSGTIKKLQSAAIVYHRKVTATAIAGLLLEGAKGEADKERLAPKWELEREEMGRLED
ncbi:uncharacterized protein EHS24_002833 [Apiotrichum porosum]|uniref:Ribonuclease P/MRP protein subunit POP5 n=1 Tax=Apiotrichum porosum TaxID=105984 RepID=A0A427XGD6_9TREE|nr:uncharacterized protein EHS24_002833 [Apiotrichum porosum]RSH77774.1 hypothetical protein EHS24_002833 [Apiotrichum porosum]